jgi:N6-L-threonylcarbamoyladenine synthase
VVYTQIPLHVPYGGVVPEIASRAHVEKICEVIRAAREQSGRVPLDAVAVTYGPGLSPALLVGLNAAKGLATALKVPLIAVNHIEAHLHTPFLDSDVDPVSVTPALGLAVSGGHTTWIDMPVYGKYAIIGQTLDDAAGEAFDKAAKLLALGYPGGPVVDRLAREFRASLGDAAAARDWGGRLIPFPKGRPRDGVSALAGLAADCCVSFSGLKTALLRYVEQNGGAAALAAAGETPRIVASYQEAIVQALAERTETALRRRRARALIVGGGVSLNSRLRTTLDETCRRVGVPLYMAKPAYCGDNAAMIAALAHYRRNRMGAAAMALDVAPSLDFED